MGKRASWVWLLRAVNNPHFNARMHPYPALVFPSSLKILTSHLIHPQPCRVSLFPPSSVTYFQAQHEHGVLQESIY